jgi:AcrR family transcriptional regulator
VAADPLGAGQPGLRERKKRDTERAIRAAALRLFLERGYADVSIDQIAEAAYVSRTTFFNYFATKEAVVAEPDPAVLTMWREVRDRRPAAEPLWQSLTVVLLDCIEQGADWIAVQKQLLTSSRAGPALLWDTDQRLIRELQSWVESRTPTTQQGLARLQLNLAVAAVISALNDWKVTRPFGEFIGTATEYLAVVGRAFPPESPG